MSARSKIVRDFSGQEVAIPYDPRDDAPKPETPGALQAVGGVIREHLPSGETIIIATDVGNYASFVTAAELVRRWNAHEVMLEALRAAHKHAHKALTAESNSYTDEANMLDVIAAALAAAGDTQRLTPGIR